MLIVEVDVLTEVCSGFYFLFCFCFPEVFTCVSKSSPATNAGLDLVILCRYLEVRYKRLLRGDRKVIDPGAVVRIQSELSVL